MQGLQADLTGQTSTFFAYVEHACLLATGAKESFTKDSAGLSKVPRSHMKAAAEIVKQVHAEYKSANYNPDNHWYGWGGTIGKLMINEAVGGISQIRNAINLQLGGSDDEVNSCKVHFLYYHYSRILAAEEFLKVLSGEKFVETSLIADINDNLLLHLQKYCECVDFAASFFPVIGTILGISKAISGGTVCNKQLTNTERIIEGTFALMPFILRVRSLAEAGKKIYSNTITADRILMASQQMNEGNIITRTFKAISIGASARAFSSTEILYVTKIYMKYIKKGIKTPIKVEGEMNRLFYKLSEAGTAVGWMKIAENPLYVANKSGKYLTLKGAKVNDGEGIVAKESSEFLDGDVIHLPENIPSRYLKGESQMSHVKYPDLLAKGKLADIYIAHIPNLEYIIAKKSKQAGMIIIDLKQKGAYSLSNTIKLFDGIWANPRAYGLETIIIFSKEGTVKLTRPEIFKINWIESVSYQTLKTITADIITSWEDK